jgi:hypothetical protein
VLAGQNVYPALFAALIIAQARLSSILASSMLTTASDR